jgi:hypothetical protein
MLYKDMNTNLNNLKKSLPFVPMEVCAIIKAPFASIDPN